MCIAEQREPLLRSSRFPCPHCWQDTALFLPSCPFVHAAVQVHASNSRLVRTGAMFLRSMCAKGSANQVRDAAVDVPFIPTQVALFALYLGQWMYLLFPLKLLFSLFP